MNRVYSLNILELCDKFIDGPIIEVLVCGTVPCSMEAISWSQSHPCVSQYCSQGVGLCEGKRTVCNILSAKG